MIKGWNLALGGIMACSLLCAGLTDVQAADKKVTLKFANVTSQSAKDAGAKFKELVEAETGGTVSVTHFPDNQLGDDRVAIETTMFGDIDIAVSSTSNIATIYADFYVFDAPFMFINAEKAYAGLDGEAGKQILKNMEKIGLKGLALWENGFRNFTNSAKPVKRPEDTKSMKIRTMENEVHLAAWKAFGANPTPMAFTELFTALQQGTVDGQENPLGIIDANRFQEVQKFVSLTQHVYTPYVVVMNLEKFNTLSDAQKAAIEKAAVESTTFQRAQSAKYEKDILDRLVKANVTVVPVSDEDKAAWQKIVTDAKVYDLAKKKMTNPKFLDMMLAQ